MFRCHGMPEGVLFDILLYLPVMSLLRFKSACKSWCSIMESPTFITQHLSHKNDEDALIIKHAPSVVSGQFYLLFGSQYEKSVYIDFDQLHWHPATDISHVGSCNGIVCLGKTISLEYALWNPALKQLRPLPLPLFCARFHEARSSGKRCAHFTVLGMDSRTSDYKVVSIALISSYKRAEDDSEMAMLGNQVEVYDVREKSCRIIYEDDVLPFMDLTGKAVFSCKSGKCFWIGRDAEDSPLLISFDFNDEVFAAMSFPDRLEETYSCLDIHNETLVFMRQADVYSDKLDVAIWMLHEFGVEESWTKMYELFLPHEYSIIPDVLSGNGEFLVSFNWNSDAQNFLIYLLNLGTQEGIFLPFSPSHCIVHYNASLISIKSANGEV